MLFDLIYAFYDQAGNRIQAGKRDEIHLANAERGHVEIVRDTLPLPRGAALLRIAVRDNTTGSLGSATVSLK